MSLAAIVIAAAHVAHPKTRLDAPTLLLLGIAVLPWLDELLESIDTPFGGLKFRHLEERLDQLQGQQASTQQVAETNEARELAEGLSTLEDLAVQYNELRKAMPKGEERTREMTTLVGQMIAAANRGETLDDIHGALGGSNLGRRLAAYALLYVRPDGALAIPLVDSIIDNEPKPFGQFWGLRSLSRVIEEGGPNVIDPTTQRRLEASFSSLDRGTDRWYELTQILDRLET